MFNQMVKNRQIQHVHCESSFAVSYSLHAASDFSTKHDSLAFHLLWTVTQRNLSCLDYSVVECAFRPAHDQVAAKTQAMEQGNGRCSAGLSSADGCGSDQA